VDAPFFYDETANWDRNIGYVKTQLQNLIVLLEEITGKPFDWDALNVKLRGISEMTGYRRQIMELGKVKPAPGGFIDAAVGFGPANTIRDENSIQFYKEYAQELSVRAKEGISVSANEKYRIMWRGNFPWFKMGTISRMLAKYDAAIVTGAYAFHNYGAVSKQYIPPDGFDFEDPLWTIAAEHCARSYTRTFDWKMKHEFRDYIEGYSIDAVIIHSPHTCRPWALTANDMASIVEKEFGIPVLVLDSDHTDPSYFHDAQVETRIQALLESVDAKRSM
jgi:benzoyl-CoA reductase subunit B